MQNAISGVSHASRGSRANEVVSDIKAIQNAEPSGSDVSATLTPAEQVTVQKLDTALRAVGSVKMGIFLEQGADQPVIKIFNKESGEEIFQIPAKHSIHIANTVEVVRGLIFDKKV
ncbi:flagellar protein FlaG [Litorivicinus sp.]|nr:flagellar protein FlaG [Litorivicinus sp.]